MKPPKNQKRFLTRALVYSAAMPLIGGMVIRGMQRARYVMARFDAAFQGWGERSWLFQALQDSWIEIDAMTRQELQRIHESLIENSPIVQKIRSLKMQFAVGPSGLKIIPESSDDGFNDARSVSWEKWWAAPELGSTISGGQLTRVWSGLLFDKGEIFVNLSYSDEVANGRVTKIPRTQTIDAHRVKSPPGKSRDDRTGFPIVDGVVINPATGQRVAYFVRRCDYSTTYAPSQTSSEIFDRIEAFKPGIGGMVHKFKVLRPGQVRGIPDGVSGFNMVRDNMDLHKLEMQCAKIASEIGVVETNPSGELDPIYNRKAKLALNTQNSAGAPVIKNSWADYNISFGGKKLALKVGSKLEDFLVRRPTVATQEYWDLHITLICIAYKVPKMLVMPYSLQGTVTRADLDVCTATFREDFEIIRELCELIFEWQGRWDIKFNTEFTGAKYEATIQSKDPIIHRQLLARAGKSRWVQDAKMPDDPQICLIRPPRAPNVDIGYTAKALEIEMRLGIKTFQRVFADLGLDWRTEIRQLAEAMVYMQDLCNEPMFKGKITPGQLSSLAVPQAVSDPTSRPDQPENPPPGGGESSPESHGIQIVYE